MTSHHSTDFFLTDPATTEIYTLSLHDALPIYPPARVYGRAGEPCARCRTRLLQATVSGRSSTLDRKSTRLNSSHPSISYAVFCLKKKKKIIILLLLIIYEVLLISVLSFLAVKY